MNEIKLRKLKSSDKTTLANLLNNKKIWDNLRNHIPFPYYEKDAEYFINSVKDDAHQQVFAIEYQQQFCGIISLILQKDIYEQTAEVGYWLGEPFWHKGIASTAVHKITSFGFDELHLRRIYAIVFENNLASMRVLEKNGYKREGILKEAIVKNGKILDEYRYYKLQDKA